MRLVVLLGISSLLLSTSCNSVMSPEELSEAQGVWQLVELSSGVSIPGSENYSVQLNADGIVRAQADCNLCNGSYETEGNNLSMGPLACTRAFCGPSSLFDQYTAALQNVSSFVRRGDELELAYSGGIMKFKVVGGT
jgi:heat shock protein HslJ